MKVCVAVRHVAFEDLGLFEEALAERDFTIRQMEAGVDDLRSADPLAADLVAVLGGPIGAYEDELYPFLKDEIALIQARLDAGRPTVGFCLGAQLMARALGARVYPNPAGKEIGWGPLTLTGDGRTSPLRALDGIDVLHWHGDIFDLPQGTRRLASTDVTPNQAFSFGRTALGLQFHPEVTGRGLERWFIGHAAEISQTTGVSVPVLRESTRRCAPALERAGREMLSAWLDDALSA
ncbi:MAG: glutamine amidotransferase [Magnetospirillum sp.]|nr:glutamine amidotransferase [Magnetospirillum sp.]